MVTLVEELTEGFVTDVAIIVTDPPVGAVVGAVYTLSAPLAVCAGLNDPHDPAGVQLHVTPPILES
jgi:hypothetical protein